MVHLLVRRPDITFAFSAESAFFALPTKQSPCPSDPSSGAAWGSNKRCRLAGCSGVAGQTRGDWGGEEDASRSRQQRGRKSISAEPPCLSMITPRFTTLRYRSSASTWSRSLWSPSSRFGSDLVEAVVGRKTGTTPRPVYLKLPRWWYKVADSFDLSLNPSKSCR